MSPVKPGYTRPLDVRHGRIDMSHGSGGRSMVQLIEQIFLSAFDNKNEFSLGLNFFII